MEKMFYHINTDPSRIDRELERLIGLLQQPGVDRAAVVASINELSSRRTRMMRPGIIRRSRRIPENSPLKVYLDKTRNKLRLVSQNESDAEAGDLQLANTA